MRARRARSRPGEPRRAHPRHGGGPSLALLGHTDVVPADPAGWRHPPFAGHLDRDGYMWGRGAVDMKNETASRAVTMAVLARAAPAPRRPAVHRRGRRGGRRRRGRPLVARPRAARHRRRLRAQRGGLRAPHARRRAHGRDDPRRREGDAPRAGHGARPCRARLDAGGRRERGAAPRGAHLAALRAPPRPAHAARDAGRCSRRSWARSTGTSTARSSAPAACIPRSPTSSGRCSTRPSRRRACAARPPATSCPRAQAWSATAACCRERPRRTSRPSCARCSATTWPTSSRSSSR